MIGKFNCLKCDYVWDSSFLGPQVCPVCAHVYVKWLNYNELFPERNPHSYNYEGLREEVCTRSTNKRE
jgi:hypothetical protein